MATSRFDNIKYWDNDSKSYKIPSQIKCWNSTTSSWIDYGDKNSTNDRKMMVYNNSAFDCITYKRRDINIPNYIQIGYNQYINLTKSFSNYVQPAANYFGGYYWEMQVVVNATTPLYTTHTKNNGDIYTSFYYNIIAEVVGNAVRLVIGSRWNGKIIYSGKYINTPYSEKRTVTMFNVGEKVLIQMNRAYDSGSLTITITRENGAVNSYSTDDSGRSLYFSTCLVENDNNHKLGSKTVDDYGDQSTYGNAKIYYFKHRINMYQGYDKVYGFSASNFGVGSTYLSNNYGDGSLTANCINTSVYGAVYSVYDRQTV